MMIELRALCPFTTPTCLDEQERNKRRRKQKGNGNERASLTSFFRAVILDQRDRRKEKIAIWDLTST